MLFPILVSRRRQDRQSPTYTSATINPASAGNTILDVQFSEALKAGTSYTNGVTIQVDGVTTAPSSGVLRAAPNNNTIRYTMPDAILALARTTWAYTAASGNIADRAGNLLANVSAQTATNSSSLLPVGGWHLDEASGTLVDFSGTGNNGTAFGALTYGVAGVIGTALQLDGVDDYVKVLDAPSLRFSDGAGNDTPFSLAQWIKLTDFTAAHDVLSKYDGSPALIREWDLIFSGSGDIRLNLFDRAAAGENYIGRSAPFTSAVYNNIWTHVVATYSGSKTSAGIRVYINGAQADDTNREIGVYTGMPATTTPVALGTRFFAGAVQLPFVGSLDDVRIYNIALTAAQITSLYNWRG